MRSRRPIYGGVCYIGGRDGVVTALDPADATVCWTFLAAHADRRLVEQSHLESSWPISGGVLPWRGSLYVVCGHHSSLEGGLTFYRLDPATGRMLGKTKCDTSPEAMEKRKPTGNYGHNRRIADILVASTSGLYVSVRRSASSGEGGDSS